MPKTSDWLIVATEGNTIDGRKIQKSWINEMAELYAKEEFTALIWPEHFRSAWMPFEGKNWGTVEALKAEEKEGQLRLFAKLTPNQFLLDANKDEQKLYTSIEIEPDYKGTGKCYLTGLAATDSPASSGTTRLKFSRRFGEETSVECAELEEIDFSYCFSRSDRFFAHCKAFFQASDPSHDSQQEDEPPMNQEQFSQVMGAITAISTKQGELEEKINTFSLHSIPTEDEPTPAAPSTLESAPGLSAEQFSQLTDKLDGIATKQGELESKFNQLSQEEIPGQRPGETGANTTVEVI